MREAKGKKLNLINKNDELFKLEEAHA